MKKVTRCFLLFALFLLLIAQVAHAERDREIIQQEDGNALVVVGYVLAATSKGVEIHAVSKSGALKLVSTLPENIAINSYGKYGDADWLISSAYDLKVSPDGSQIAFIAENIITTDKTKLFIEQIKQHNLIQKELAKSLGVWSRDSNPLAGESDLAELSWSPDSNSLLINGNQTTVYDLKTDTFTPITDFHFGIPLWLTDNQHIVYTGAGIPCDAPCKAYHDLYAINRDGTENHSITNLGIQLPAEANHTICGATWSAWNNRIYYSVGCTIGGYVIENLYSTTLSGDNRLENVPDDLTNLFNHRITNLNVDNTNQAVYVSTVDTRLDRNLTWEVFRITSNKTKETIFSSPRKYEDAPQRITLSPNRQYISLTAYDYLDLGTGNGFLEVIDTTNGQVAASKNNLQNICQLVWSDNHTIIFTQQVGGYPDCPDDYYPIKAWSLSKFDFETSNVTPLTDKFTTPTFFITVPES